MDDGYDDVDTDLIDEIVYQELYKAGIDIDEKTSIMDPRIK